MRTISVPFPSSSLHLFLALLVLSHLLLLHPASRSPPPSPHLSSLTTLPLHPPSSPSPSTLPCLRSTASSPPLPHHILFLFKFYLFISTLRFALTSTVLVLTEQEHRKPSWRGPRSTTPSSSSHLLSIPTYFIFYSNFIFL